MFVGDFISEKDAVGAMKGIDMVYYVCNDVNPFEDEIGLRLIEIVKKAGNMTFFYHSVLHSLTDLEGVLSRLTGSSVASAFISGCELSCLLLYKSKQLFRTDALDYVPSLQPEEFRRKFLYTDADPRARSGHR